MRIDYLKLLAFGSFTDEEIHFSKECGLHLIYGTNEAGKSTMLRAIADALFGIPHNSPDGFLHKYSDLRIEAGLTLQNGSSLVFRRRKGLKNTFLDLNDKALNEQLLAPYTAGLNRSQFENMFGLDHLRLREGGSRLLESGGSLGESLFEAASGLGDLRRIMKTLEKEADLLFRPTAKNPPINDLSNQYKTEKSLLADVVLSAQNFKTLEKQYNEQHQALVALENRLREAERIKTRLTRIRRTKPVLAERQNLIEELDQLGNLPRLSNDSKANYAEFAETLRQTEIEKSSAFHQIERLEEEVQQLDIPEAIIEQEDAIDQLQQDLGQYRRAIKDLPNLENELEFVEQTAFSKLKELSPNATTLAEAEEYRLSLHVLDRVDELVEDFKKLATNLDRARENLENKTIDLKSTRRALADLGPLVETTQLQRLVSNIQNEGNLEKLYQKTKQEAEQLQQSLNSDLKRLPCWTGSLEELVVTEFPLTSTITQFAKEHAELVDDLRSLQKEIRDKEYQVHEVERELTLISKTGAVPSIAELHKAREKRSQGWQLVLKSWLNKEPDQQGEIAFAGDKPLHLAYEASVLGADSLADKLRQESDRVARKASLEANLLAINQELEQKRTELGLLQAKGQDLKQRWDKIWAAAKITPLSPQEMLEWSNVCQAIVEKHKELVLKLKHATELEKQIISYTQNLQEALTSCGLLPQANLADLVEQASDFCHAISVRQGEHKSISARLAKEEAEIDFAKKKVEAALDAQEKWVEQWIVVMEQVKLPQDATVKVAQNFITELRALFELLDKLAAVEKTTKQQKTFITQYEKNVAEVLAKVDLSLESGNIPHAVTTLIQRIRKANSDLATKREKVKQMEEQKAKIADLESQITRTKEKIANLMEEANVATEQELAEILDRHAQALSLEVKLEELERQLIFSGDGLTLEELESEAETVDLDAIPYDLQQIQAELTSLNQEQNKLNQSFGVVKKDYEEKIQGKEIAASQGAEKSQETLAQLAHEVEKYMQFKLAFLVLRKAIERYRDENQDPVLARAGEIFSQLTGGSFNQLVIDYDTNENPIIRAIRQEEKVGVEGMSDGTQDQLYLALRLASIEHYLDQGEPMPFIVDDVLINFDDFRSAAAMQALAKLAKRTQVIMFTHHVSIVQMAKKVLPEQDLEIHVLGEVSEPVYDETLQFA